MRDGVRTAEYGREHARDVSTGRRSVGSPSVPGIVRPAIVADSTHDHGGEVVCGSASMLLHP
jgi:hypothetical protein